MRRFSKKAKSFSKFALLALATGAGLGYAPLASGTFGTLPGIAIVWMLKPIWRPDCRHWQILIALLLALAAVPICELAERYFKNKDDGRIVADEYLIFPLCLIGLPLTWTTLLTAFITARAMDIIKPPPARRLQALRGGVGIVIDDVIAALYSLLLNHLIWRLWLS